MEAAWTLVVSEDCWDEAVTLCGQQLLHNWAQTGSPELPNSPNVLSAAAPIGLIHTRGFNTHTDC